MWKILGFFWGALLSMAICNVSNMEVGTIFCFGTSLGGFGILLGAIADNGERK